MAFVALVVALPALVRAEMTVGGGNTGGVDSSSAAASAVLTTGGSNTGGADSNTNSNSAALTTSGANTGGADSNPAGNTTLTTGGSNTGGADSNTNSNPTVLTTGGSNTGGADSNTGGNTPPVTPPSGGGGGGGGGSYFGSSGGYSGGSSVLVSGLNHALTASSSCPLIPDGIIMEIGRDNDPVQVAKIQAFLKNTQESDVDVTGTFDQKTEDAVRAFQEKYMSDIMGPWGATQTSGNVYITTVKKVNELACARPLSLTTDELATIEAYKTAIANGTGASAIGANGDLGSTTATLNGSTSSDQTGNTASVGNISIFQRFWNFIVRLFR